MVQKDSVKNKVLIICGPTASGKTRLAVECAKLLNSEVISADSMNVYKGLDVGTAKPTEKEKSGIPHHSIDVVDPKTSFSVGDYREIAAPILERVISDGKIPIICGGTGFYINSLIYKMSYGNVKADFAVREKYKRLAQEKGNEYVFSVLKQKDPASAEKLHYNDLKRVIRALEIAENGNIKSQLNDDKTPIFNYFAFSVDIPREELYAKIDLRVDEMIKNGLIEEVKSLLGSGVKIADQCMQGIGYKEIAEYLNGEITEKAAIEKIKLNTRHYAKRQITFFNKQLNVRKLPPDSAENNAKRILSYL